MSERVTFLASFPPIQSAIKRSGNGDGMRVQIDIPETEMGNAAMLLAWTQNRLRVTIEVVADTTQSAAHKADKRSRDFTLIDTEKDAHDG